MLFLVLLNDISRIMHVLSACKVWPNGACSHWLLLEHMTLNNETVTCQNPLSRPHDIRVVRVLLPAIVGYNSDYTVCVFIVL